MPQAILKRHSWSSNANSKLESVDDISLVHSVQAKVAMGNSQALPSRTLTQVETAQGYSVAALQPRHNTSNGTIHVFSAGDQQAIQLE